MIPFYLWHPLPSSFVSISRYLLLLLLPTFTVMNTSFFNMTSFKTRATVVSVVHFISSLSTRVFHEMAYRYIHIKFTRTQKIFKIVRFYGKERCFGTSYISNYGKSWLWQRDMATEAFYCHWKIILPVGPEYIGYHLIFYSMWKVSTQSIYNNKWENFCWDEWGKENVNSYKIVRVVKQ